MSVKTLEQAIALPEIQSEFWEESRETLPDGTTVVHRKARPFSPIGVSGDDIILFTDERGAWKVVMTENGPAKVRFYL